MNGCSGRSPINCGLCICRSVGLAIGPIQHQAAVSIVPTSSYETATLQTAKACQVVRLDGCLQSPEMTAMRLHKRAERRLTESSAAPARVDRKCEMSISVDASVNLYETDRR